jgi:1-acyl-sn-glycerol-3-phosphate acyltransferase
MTSHLEPIERLKFSTGVERTLDMDELDRGYHPRFALGFGLFLHHLTRVWFRYQFRHADRIPARPCLLIANHSGAGIADVLCLVGAWADQFRGTRRGVGMMHKMYINAPVIGTIARGFGAVPADPRSGALALERGHDVLSFPGGDIDSSRPFTEARRVIFGQRRGYIRLALAAGVPIVPVATIGSHYTYTLLPGGTTIARVTGMKHWARAERYPLILGSLLAIVAFALALASLVPWWVALLAGLSAVIPNPVRVTTEVLPAIDVAARTLHITDPDERIEAAHQLVLGALEQRVAAMQHREEAPVEHELVDGSRN